MADIPIGGQGTYSPEQSAPVAALTDGTGISALTTSKLVKDFVADALMGAAAALVSGQILDVGSAVNQPQVVAFALAGAVIGALYRTVLRWATTT